MDEKFEKQFKEIAARYCSVKAEDITNDMSFRCRIQFRRG